TPQPASKMRRTDFCGPAPQNFDLATFSSQVPWIRSLGLGGSTAAAVAATNAAAARPRPSDANFFMSFLPDYFRKNKRGGLCPPLRLDFYILNRMPARNMRPRMSKPLEGLESGET